jgi:hypothetical protein
VEYGKNNCLSPECPFRLEQHAQDASYQKVAADCIHLNPARTGLVGGRMGKLVDDP